MTTAVELNTEGALRVLIKEGYPMADISIKDYPKAITMLKKLWRKNKKEGEVFGWLDLPEEFDQKELALIENTADKIRKQAKVLVVIGVGGSYLGARAGLEFLYSPYYNQLPHPQRPEIYFAGNNLSSSHLQEILELIGERDFSVNVISKSGTTLEPALAFRVFRQVLVDKYGQAGARERIYVTTDSKEGALRKLAHKEKYQTLSIPRDIGGRYSVLTAVGLLPLAVAGAKIEKILAGAEQARFDLGALGTTEMEVNDACRYALTRQLFYQQGRNIEVMGVFEPRLKQLGAWWQQLFAESEGKEGQGLYPDVVEFTGDLHSLGQYLQEGKKQIIETQMCLKETPKEIRVPENDDYADGLKIVAGKKLSLINEQAMEGTALAHEDGGTPVMKILIKEVSETSLGYLFYFFEVAAAVSAYLLDVNPFDQPGVEAYKKNVHQRLKNLVSKSEG
jgi:glucose-6-phosphate isomerase